MTPDVTHSSGADAGAAPPLRFGIMCDGPNLAAWQARCVDELLSVPGVEAVLLIVDDDPRLSPAGKLRRLLPGRTILWRIYQRIVLKRGSPATWPVDLGPELARLPAIRCRTEPVGKYARRFGADDVRAIGAYDLDFIMRFGFNILSGEILTVARYGVWSFHHGDPGKYRGAPPAFWEIHNRDDVTGAVLQRLTERLDSGVILQSGWFKTNASSYIRSRDEVFFGAADWPAKVCRDIRSGHADYVDAPPLVSQAPVYRAPRNMPMLRFLRISAGSWIKVQLVSFFREQQWAVGVIDAPVHEVVGLGGDKILSHPVRWVPEPPGRFLADPFAIEHSVNGAPRLTIVAEDYDWSTGFGRISTFGSSDFRTFDAPRLLMNFPFHMSYPFLLEHDGRSYCIPETNEAREVCLYAFDPASLLWSKEATLLSGHRIVDATPFRYGDRWWLFGTDEEQGANSKLFLWHASELAGPWEPHPANPVKTDVRSSRPAGKPFVHEGRLYRPSQDCSQSYGAAVTLNRIDRLTTTEFCEEPVASLRPDPESRYPKGLHTVVGVGGRTIIDARRDMFVRQAFNQAVARKMGALLSKLGLKRREIGHDGGNHES